MRRRQARELAMRMLFQTDVGHQDVESVLASVEDLAGVGADTAMLARTLYLGTYEHLAEIDAVLNRYAGDWPVYRMASVDRNVLRLACYELLYRKEVPAAIVINDAVEIAKRYGTEDSSRFVNGILGAIHKVNQSGEGDNG